MGNPLDTDVALLLGRMERGAVQTAARAKFGPIVMGGLFVAMGILVALIRGAVVMGVAVAVFGALLFAVGTMAARRNSPERAARVLRALQDAPERVVSIRHYEIRHPRGVLRTHSVEVKTEDGRLVVRANDDWKPLVAQLVQRCPRAQLIEGLAR